MPVSKKYAVKEIFGPTLQGEGAMSGMPVRFVRFAGCNMWDGREATKAESKCPYCDTDFFGGEMMTAADIILRLKYDLPGSETRWVVLSGGEPMLQVDLPLLRDLAEADILISVESNGTVEIPLAVRAKIQHLTISPKLPWEDLKVRSADCLKLLYPHPNPRIRPEDYADFAATTKYLQPIDEQDEDKNHANVLLTIDKLHHLRNWRLSLQMHKALNLP